VKGRSSPHLCSCAGREGSAFVAVTAALWITAPVESITVPAIFPVSDCAQRLGSIRQDSRTARAVNNKRKRSCLLGGRVIFIKVTVSSKNNVE
jgi:hypothetical protein